jgi:hypothetical protein
MPFVSRWYPSYDEPVTDVGGLSAMLLRKHPLPEQRPVEWCNSGGAAPA